MLDKRFMIAHVSAIVLLGTALVACGIDPNKSLEENYQTVKDNITSTTALQACVGGVLIGAGTGYAISGGEAMGAVAGGIAGGLVGCTAGATLNARRAEFASEAEFFDNQLAVAQQTNARLVDYRNELNGQIKSNGATLSDLNEQIANASLDQEEAQFEYEAAGALYNDARENLRLAKLELDVQKQALEEHGTTPQGSVNQTTIQQLSQEVTTMEGYVGELESQVEALGKQRDAIGQFA